MDHFDPSDPGHTHDHGHSHAHGHDHDKAATTADGEYFIEQLLTILVCGAVGVIGVALCLGGQVSRLASPEFYETILRGGAAAGSRLGFLLAPEFHRWVLLGSFVLIVLTAIRMVTLWSQASAGKVESGHVHGPDCDHDHDHAHSHDGHDHSSGAMYLKVIPFALPVLLYAMGLPNGSFSKEFVQKRLGDAEKITDVAVADKGGDVIPFDFNELNAAAYDPAKRQEYEGRRIRVKGQLSKVSEKDYQLFKLKMTCCAADVIPLKARIKSNIIIPGSQFPNQSWATVEGVLQFVELPEKKQFLPVIRIGEKGNLGLTPAKPE